jgi:hypothetical protein
MSQIINKRPAFISGGLGDFIAIESFLTPDEKRAVTGFYLFTRAAAGIKTLIEAHPIWQYLPVTIPFTPMEIRSFNTYAFFNIPSVFNITQSSPGRFGYLQDCFDFSGDALYPDILRGDRQYSQSLFDFSGIPNMKHSCVIDPESGADDRLVSKGRNLTDAEIQVILLSHPGAFFIGQGRTNLIEAMAAVQQSPVFCGVDSAMAAWACRCPGVEKIQVKTVNSIYKICLPIYDRFKKVEIIEGGKRFGI